MNLREIKKDIEYVLGAFVEDCSIFATVNPNASEEEIVALMDEAATLYNELKDKVNVKVEGAGKAYFQGIRQELLQGTDALYEKLAKAVKEAAEAPAEKKSPAKKAAPAKKAPAKKVEAPATEEKPAAEKKAPAKKAPAKKATAEKPAAEKKAAPAKKAPAKKPAAKKAE